MLQLFYKVQLLTYSGENRIQNCKPWFITERLSCMHDAHEFVHWFACKVSSSFAYRIFDFSEDKDLRYIHPYAVQIQSPIECLYSPPTPLYMHIKKKRLIDRHPQGYFYEFAEPCNHVYKCTPLTYITASNET